MKIKTFRRCAAIVLALIMLLTLLASCSIIDGFKNKTCTEHTDKDGDRVCDKCGTVLEGDEPCTEHTGEWISNEFSHQYVYTCGCASPDIAGLHSDTDEDGKCDECGYEMKTECTEHTDEDEDMTCDRCGAVLEGDEPCTEHTGEWISNEYSHYYQYTCGCASPDIAGLHSDDDGDGKCDECGYEMKTECTEHTDENEDMMCDECGECIVHRDSNCDGKCDGCEDGMAIEHRDNDGDRKCDGCGKCLTHTDGNCDGRCDDCESAVKIEHDDSDGDGACDKCECCLEHRDADCNNECDNCSEEVNLGHSDQNSDDVCDKCGGCIAHVDSECNGKCDRCDADVTVTHKDDDGNNLCDKCGLQVLPISYTVRKSASIPEGAMLYPETYIEWSGKTLRGSLITYTITVTNTGENTANLTVTDTVPEGTVYIGGCENKTDNRLTWTVSVPVGEEVSVSYTVSVDGGEEAVGTYILGGCATVGKQSAECYNLYVGKVLNEVDAKYIEKAIRILSPSTFTALDFAKHAYTVAFTNPKAITELMSGTPEEVLALINAGSDEKLSGTVVLKSGEGAAPLKSTSLVSGDLIFVNAPDGVRLYIVCASQAYNITNTATKVGISALIDEISGGYDYAVVRPSITMKTFTPSDPDEQPEQMTAYQEAIVKTAEAYLMRGESLQYEDVNFALTSKTGEYRWAHGQKLPEEYTSDEWGYVNCAVFTYDVYLAALGYTLPSNMYTTERLTQNAAANGMSVFVFERERDEVYTEAEQLEIQRTFMQTLKVGDIIVRRHTNVSSGKTTGHAMLYVGNGRFIHSGGASYTQTGGVGSEVYEPTIRCHKVSDYLFGSATTSMFNDEYNIITIVRPLNKFDGEIPEDTIGRIENMQDIRAEKTSSHPSSNTVNPGDLITFTFTLLNVGDSDRTVDIYDKLPDGTSYVSGGERVVGDELYWTVTVPRGESVSVSYTVKVGELADGTVIGSRYARVGGVMHRCADIRVKNTLTANEQSAIIAAIEALKNEGTSLTKLELVNAIYERALGITPFTDTVVNSVMRDGAEAVFLQSSVKNGSLYASKLREDTTYYSRMLVDHLYGGMRFNSAEKLYDRTRLLKAHNLIVGDVLIARSSSAENVYIYAGDGNLILLNSGIGEPANFGTLAERILYFGRDFAVLRPSFVAEQAQNRISKSFI